MAVGAGVTLPRHSCVRVVRFWEDSGDKLGTVAGATGLMSDVPEPEPRRRTRQDVLGCRPRRAVWRRRIWAGECVRISLVGSKSDTANTGRFARRSLAGDTLLGRRDEGMRIAPAEKDESEGSIGGTGAMAGGGTGLSGSPSTGALECWTRNLREPLSSLKCWQPMSNWVSSRATPIVKPPNSMR